MEDWLHCVSKMAILNGIADLDVSNAVIRTLAYAYQVNLTPIEAVAFLRLVANKMRDDDPDEAREIEARAQDLMLIARPHEDYDVDLVRQHVSRFIEIPMSDERQPEPSRPISLRQVSEELRQIT